MATDWHCAGSIQKAIGKEIWSQSELGEGVMEKTEKDEKKSYRIKLWAENSNVLPSFFFFVFSFVFSSFFFLITSLSFLLRFPIPYPFSSIFKTLWLLFFPTLFSPFTFVSLLRSFLTPFSVCESFSLFSVLFKSKLFSPRSRANRATFLFLISVRSKLARVAWDELRCRNGSPKKVTCSLVGDEINYNSRTFHWNLRSAYRRKKTREKQSSKDGRIEWTDLKKERQIKRKKWTEKG